MYKFYSKAVLELLFRNWKSIFKIYLFCCLDLKIYFKIKQVKMTEEKIQMMEIETRKIIVNSKSINENKSGTLYLNMGKVIYLGFLFLLFLSVYNSLQNMITLLYKQFGYDRLGTFTMLSLFFIRGLSNLIGPLLTYIYPYNRLFLACSLSILPILIAGKLTSECSDDNVKEEKKCSEFLLFGLHTISSICLGFFHVRNLIHVNVLVGIH